MYMYQIDIERMSPLCAVLIYIAGLMFPATERTGDKTLSLSGRIHS